MKHEFPSPVLRHEASPPYHYLPVPDDIAQQLLRGPTRRVLVHVGGVTARRFLFRVPAEPEPCHAVMLGLDTLKSMGVAPGDMAIVAMETDPEPDRIDICDELAEALRQDDHAAGAFSSMTLGRQRGLAAWVASGKKTETRIRRALQLCEKMHTED